MKKYIAPMLVLTLVIATLVTLFPQGALAANGDGVCNTNEICVYKNANLVTPRSDFCCKYADYGGCPDCHTYNYPSSCNTWNAINCLLNDTVSSMDSWDLRYKIRFFSDHYYDGVRETMVEYGRVLQARYNDAYSSHCWNDGEVSYSEDVDCTF